MCGYKYFCLSITDIYLFINIAKATLAGAVFVIMKGGRIEKMILSENEH